MHTMAFGLGQPTPDVRARGAVVRIEVLGDHVLVVNAGDRTAYGVALRVTDVDPSSHELVRTDVRTTTNPVDLAPRATAMVHWCTGTVTRARFEVGYRTGGPGGLRDVVARSAVRDGTQVHPDMLD